MPRGCRPSRFAKNESPCLESNQGLQIQSLTCLPLHYKDSNSAPTFQNQVIKVRTGRFGDAALPAQQICLARKAGTSAAQNCVATNHLKCQPPLISFFSNPNQTFEGLDSVICPKCLMLARLA